MIDLAPGVRIRPEEVVLRATAAGGPGGQNVNKVATRIELVWDIAGSPSLEEEVRERLLDRLAPRLDKEGRVRLVASEHRTQARNREEALERLRVLVAEALEPEKERRPTKPPRAAKRRRIEGKRRRGEVKRLRKEPPE